MKFYVYHVFLSPDSTSDPIYLSAGFFEGSTGVGRHFSISYINVTLTTPSDPSTLETTELFRTINANNNWLRFPVTFVGSQKVDYSSTSSATDFQFWFVFLRENLVSGDVIYSRLVRICRNDPGSEMTSGGARYFTTYMKARIFCKRDKPSSLEFTGTLDYIYNGISKIYTIYFIGLLQLVFMLITPYSSLSPLYSKFYIY